jgi:hypothetical protein
MDKTLYEEREYLRDFGKTRTVEEWDETIYELKQRIKKLEEDMAHVLKDKK